MAAISSQILWKVVPFGRVESLGIHVSNLAKNYINMTISHSFANQHWGAHTVSLIGPSSYPFSIWLKVQRNENQFWLSVWNEHQEKMSSASAPLIGRDEIVFLFGNTGERYSLPILSPYTPESSIDLSIVLEEPPMELPPIENLSLMES